MINKVLIDQPSKRKRFSKKRKEVWRKHIDTKDLDNFLDEQRLEERIGKASEKTDEQLFRVDIQADPKLFTAKTQRKLKAARPPKCFASLVNTSQVTDPISKRNHVRTQEEKVHYKKKLEKRANGIVSQRELQSTTDRLNEYRKQNELIKQKQKKQQKEFTHDIWSMGALKDQRSEFRSPWIDQNVTEHNILNTGTPVANVPKSAFHKRSQLKSIAIPHPGTSYNPTLKDHQDLLNLVVEQESKIIRKEDHLNRVTTSMFDRVTSSQRDRMVEKDFNAILVEPDDELSENDDGEAYNSINAPVVVKPKDAKARRKQREQKEIKQALLKRKLEKKKMADIVRVRLVKNDIADVERKIKKMRKRKESRRIVNLTSARRIGPMKFQEEDIEINEPTKIAGNLRNLKMEGNILVSQFRSMQKRNILAPTVDNGLVRRREIKRFTRTTHKEEVKRVTGEQMKLLARK